MCVCVRAYTCVYLCLTAAVNVARKQQRQQQQQKGKLPTLPLPLRRAAAKVYEKHTENTQQQQQQQEEETQQQQEHTQQEKQQQVESQEEEAEDSYKQRACRVQNLCLCSLHCLCSDLRPLEHFLFIGISLSSSHPSSHLVDTSFHLGSVCFGFGETEIFTWYVTLPLSLSLSVSFTH